MSAIDDGDCPAGWARASLNQVCLSIADGDHQPPPQVEKGVPFLVIGNVRDGLIDFSETRFVSESYFRSLGTQRRPSRGDVLYTVTGSFGIPALVTTDQPFCVQRQIAILKPASRMFSSYLAHALGTAAVFRQASDAATGTAQKTVGLMQLRKFTVPIAPLPEQHRIVEAIESYFTRLDDTVATLERVQQNLKRYRASVLKAAVEGRLVPTEAELARAEGRDYEPASVLLERVLAQRRRRWQGAGARGKYEEPVAPATPDLPDLPEGWCWATVDALASLGSQNGLYVPKSQYGTGVPILRIDDYQTDWSRSSNELQRVNISNANAEKYDLAVGDIVINRVNSPSHLGKSLAVLERHVPAVFESNMMRFALATDVLPEFLQHYLSSTAGKIRLTSNAKWAVNQASINQADVGGTAVPLPPVAEQRRIVVELGRLLSTVTVSEHISAAALARSARLRQAILKWAFEGSLADQDPSDEPATALLEHIRSQTSASRLSAGDAGDRRRRRSGRRRSARAENKP